MISINNNLMASDVANTLTGHYGRLSTSIERLSSGLRINSAADDAAGLAIREMMRADIAALNQGVRNANDAISMIQTFDGALGVIDEKLIRMKELAEQAATGTYTSDQRLMIDNEFQAMGEEINRIARSTDFNGIKLIDGDFDPSAVQITGPDGKTYDTTLTGNFVDAWNSANATQNGGWDTSGITNPGALVGNTNISITNNNIMQIDGKFFMVDAVGTSSSIPNSTTINIKYQGSYIDPLDNITTIYSFDINGTRISTSNPSLLTWTDNSDPNNVITLNASLTDANGNPLNFSALTAGSTGSMTAQTAPSFTMTGAPAGSNLTTTLNGNTLDMVIDLGNGNTISQSWNVTNGEDRAVSAVSINLKVVDTSANPDGPTDPNDPMNPNYKIPDDVVRVHFGPGADHKEDFYDIKKHDATLKGLGLNGVNIDTQAKAQDALVQVNDAIIEKDKIRAEFGATQNRLENTITNLTTQSENLQAAESRISDADIAHEMTTFVRNQVLTNSAVAMLAQANSVPQMVMRLIGA